MLLCSNTFKKQLWGLFPPFCAVAFQSPEVLNQMLFIEHTRIPSCRSVLREVASLVPRGGARVVLLHPSGSTAKPAVTWLRAAVQPRALWLCWAMIHLSPHFSSHCTLPARLLHVVLSLCSPKEQFLHHSHKQWVVSPFAQQQPQRWHWVCCFIKADIFQRKSEHEKAPLELCLH